MDAASLHSTMCSCATEVRPAVGFDDSGLFNPATGVLHAVQGPAFWC
jgi:hypothetical protein